MLTSPIVAIEDNVSGGRDAFLAEWMVQDAVIRNFEIIGEAATRLSPVIRDNGNIPFGQ